MLLEQKINYFLNKNVKLKRVLKRIYQKIMVGISPKAKPEGNIFRISPEDGAEYFFGYYDKSPWDISGRYVLCLRAKDTWSDVSPRENADIILIDTLKPISDPDRVRKIAETSAWNVQQACMLQWLGPDFCSRIIYNDFRDDRYCSVILTLETMEEKVFSAPVYTVSADGTFALTLDFSRLYNLRPGYGYYNVPEKTKGIALPDTTAVWKLDLDDGSVSELLKYTDFAGFKPRAEMQKEAVHKVNHLMLSPNGKRFMVLYRWFVGQKKYTRLITCNTDGSDMFLLLDDDMVSHCYWKNDDEIIAFANKKEEGLGYYLMRDRSSECTHLWKKYNNDGHPSYSPDRSLVVTDSYPNRKRISDIKILKDTDVEAEEVRVIAKVFAPFKYDNDTRCDLHPRWSRDGKMISFDSVHEGHRGLYAVSLDGVTVSASVDNSENMKEHNMKKRIRIVYLMTCCKNVGPVKQTLNIIKNLDLNEFEPILITLYDEPSDSRIEEYLSCLSAHYFIKTGKKSILLGKDNELRQELAELSPDVIHSVGVFPDYAVSKIGKYNQIHTLRNYVYEDYLMKFGKIKGLLLARMQLYAMKKSKKTVTCSKSLSDIYRKKLKKNFDFIRNGVDVEGYTMADAGEKSAIRAELGLPSDAFVFVYTGQFIERKNIPFLLENYAKEFSGDDNCYMLMLGDGPVLQGMKTQYAHRKDIDFRGNVSEVSRYLKGCDAYISTSRSEGLPNGVLEAMACGLPVVLSDIEQHKEIYDTDISIGYIYKQDNSDDFRDKLARICKCDYAIPMGKSACESAHKYFNARVMSQEYQKVYKEIARAE